MLSLYFLLNFFSKSSAWVAVSPQVSLSAGSRRLHLLQPRGSMPWINAPSRHWLNIQRICAIESNKINASADDKSDGQYPTSGLPTIEEENLTFQSMLADDAKVSNAKAKSRSPTKSTTSLSATTRIGFRQKVPIKQSLLTYGTDRIVIENPWLLTAISVGHYLLYPLGLGLAWLLFSRVTEMQLYITEVIGTSKSSSLLSVFLILVGHLMNAWGSAMAGTLVHETEDWQIAELATPSDYSNQQQLLPASRIVDAAHSNNPQLYSVAFTMLLGSIAMGNLCIVAGVFDIAHNVWIQSWAVFSVLGYFLAKDEPYCTSFWNDLFSKSKVFQGTSWEQSWNQLTDYGRKQIFRVSAFKFHGIFLPNAMLCAAALVKLFGFCATIPIWMAPLPLLLSSMGGIWEGLVAETTFDQRHHLVAIVLICGGYALYFPFYSMLFASID